MKRKFSVLLFLTLVLIPGLCPAANWYVVKGASGDGTAWNSAWDITNIAWSSVFPGDTIYIAGVHGRTAYSSFTFGANGTSNARIYMKRATASDHGTSTGWKSSYDSQVIIAGPIIYAHSKGSYLTLTGQVSKGIRIVFGDAGRGIACSTVPQYGEVLYTEFAGPGDSRGYAYTDETRALELEQWNGSSYNNAESFHLAYCDLHGASTLICVTGSNNLIVEHCKFYDTNRVPPSTVHPNVIFAVSTNGIFRYNEVTNWSAEGILASGGLQVWYVYSNLWHDAAGGRRGIDRTFEIQQNPVRLYWYHNTVVNAGICNPRTIGGSGPSYDPHSQERNNIYWDYTQRPCGIADRDYNFWSGTKPPDEVHSMASGHNPFSDPGAGDYKLSGDSAPQGRGVALPSSYGTDFSGNAFYNPPSMGAYEYIPLGKRPKTTDYDD